MGLIKVDVDKFKEDKECYNMKFCTSIKNNWVKHINFVSKKITEVKNEETKKRYLELRNNAYDNLFKIDKVIDDLQ